jgi:hypothetical protein
MRDQPLYVDQTDDAEFWGEGPAPIGETKACVCVVFDPVTRSRQRGTMKAVISPAQMGDPPIFSWSWECKCGRTRFGGRWQE